MISPFDPETALPVDSAAVLGQVSLCGRVWWPIVDGFFAVQKIELSRVDSQSTRRSVLGERVDSDWCVFAGHFLSTTHEPGSDKAHDLANCLRTK